MKNLGLLVMVTGILVFMTGCTPAGNFFTRPNMTADTLTIKVGQTLTINMFAPTRFVTGGNTDLTFVDTGFIYSPKQNQLPTEPPAPYLTKETGFFPGSEPNLFPVDADLEVILPITGNDNVPPRVHTIKEGDQSKVSFVLKGKTVGIAVLRGGFLTTAVQYPDRFQRTPAGYPEYDGEITIQVVP